MSVTALDVLQALLKRSSLAWKVGLLLGSAKLGGPWVKIDTCGWGRAELPYGNLLVTVNARPAKGIHHWAIDKGNGPMVRGTSSTIGGARTEDDETLIKLGYILVDGPHPMPNREEAPPGGPGLHR